MTFKDDIIRRINTDFGVNSNQAIEALTKAIEKTAYLKTPRVVRCIIFLSKGSLDELNRYIEVATNDTRDVMLWAEYENLDDYTKLKRLRDFNKTFEKSMNNVKD
jgi:hypothetical protein